MKSSKRVFLSCVTSEMKEYRELIADDLRLPNIEVKTQEEFTTGGQTLLEKLDDYIAFCDVVVHLIGIRPGVSPTPNEIERLISRHPDFFEKIPSLQAVANEISYTQWEIWLAIYHEKLCLIYVLESLQNHQGIQHDHWQRVGELGKDYGVFSDREDLRVQVLRDIQQIKRFSKRKARRNLVLASGLIFAISLAAFLGPWFGEKSPVRKFDVEKPVAGAVVSIESFSEEVFKDVQAVVPSNDQNVLVLAQFLNDVDGPGDIFVKIVTDSETSFRTYSVSRTGPVTFATKKDVPDFNPLQVYPDNPGEHPLFEISSDRLKSPIGFVLLEQNDQLGVPAFYLGQTEVTLGQVRDFIQDQGGMADLVLNLSDADDFPVVIESSRFALNYCKWLRQNVDSRIRFRLPTLGEWRISALDQIEEVRLAQKSDDFSVLMEKANLTGVLARTKSVKKAENGLYDLIGNVSEICEAAPTLSLTGEAVAAGGSCSTDRAKLLDTKATEPFELSLPTGFRLAASASSSVKLSVTNDCDQDIYIELLSLRMKRTARRDDPFKGRSRNGLLSRVYPGWNLIRAKLENGLMRDIETRYIPFVTTTNLSFALDAGNLSVASGEGPARRTLEGNRTSKNY